MSTVALPHESNVCSYLEKRPGGENAPGPRQEGKFLDGEESGSTKSLFNNSLCMLGEELQLQYHNMYKLERRRLSSFAQLVKGIQISSS